MDGNRSLCDGFRERKKIRGKRSREEERGGKIHDYANDSGGTPETMKKVGIVLMVEEDDVMPGEEMKSAGGETSFSLAGAPPTRKRKLRVRGECSKGKGHLPVIVQGGGVRKKSKENN